METEGKLNKDNEVFEKMDDFINSYTELSNAMYDIGYDFAEDYPLDKSFHDIDFIGWAEATRVKLSEKQKKVKVDKTNTSLDKKDKKKESTIEKLNKLKDKVDKDSIRKAQEKAENNKNDREM